MSIEMTKEILQTRLDEIKLGFDEDIAKPIEEQRELTHTQYIVFLLGDELFGWNINKIQEIKIEQRITPLPMEESAIYGVINYKNQVTPVLNLHYYLGFKSPEYIDTNIVIITKNLKELVAVLVDRLIDISNFDEKDISSRPISIGNDILDEIIAGQTYYKDRIVGIINPQSLLAQ